MEPRLDTLRRELMDASEDGNGTVPIPIVPTLVTRLAAAPVSVRIAVNTQFKSVSDLREPNNDRNSNTTHTTNENTTTTTTTKDNNNNNHNTATTTNNKQANNDICVYSCICYNIYIYICMYMNE